METDKLLPRHQRILEFLTTNSPKRFTTMEIAKGAKVAHRTVVNEIRLVLSLCPTIQRSMRAQVYKYYVGSPETSLPQGFEDLTKPVTNRVAAQVVVRVVKPDWQAPAAKLAWKLPYALSLVVQAASSGNLSHLSEAREALESALEASTAYVVVLSRLLSTPQLWEDPASFWGQEIPEDLGKATTEVLDRYAKLAAQQEPTTEGL